MERLSVMKEKEDKVSKTAMVNAAFNKLPFLDCFDRTKFRKVSRRFIDADVLSQSSEYRRTTNPMGSGSYVWIERRIHLFSKDGEPLAQVGVRKESQVVSSGFWLWKKRKTVEVDKFFEETVNEALTRVGIDRVWYIVGILVDELIIAVPSAATIKEGIEKEAKRADSLIQGQWEISDTSPKRL